MSVKYHPAQILSENRKTAVSLDLPIKGHCRPTPICAFCCYAKSGPQAFPNATRKHDFVSTYLAGNDIRQLIIEAKTFTAVRLSGSGDLNMKHLPNIIRLARACHQTMFWGMTRKPEIATALMKSRTPNLRMMVTVDASSPAGTWNYKGRLCYGPRRAPDSVPKNDKRIVTVFPRHCTGRICGDVPKHKLDCPAVRHTITGGCLACGRCWNWKL